MVFEEPAPRTHDETERALDAGEGGFIHPATVVAVGVDFHGGSIEVTVTVE